MIEITQTAQDYFNKLIGQQDEEGLGLRISVSHPGTPGAACDLQFCPAGQNMPDDHVREFEGFNLYVADASVKWLDKAEIDFEEDPTGGQLTIKAPGIKGDEPGQDAALEDRVSWLLQTEINPALACIQSGIGEIPPPIAWTCCSRSTTKRPPRGSVLTPGSPRSCPSVPGRVSRTCSRAATSS